jgi:hypothetical protein
MDRPSQNHRDPWFAPFFKQVLEDSKVREMKRRERGEQPGRERSALVHLSTSSPLISPSLFRRVPLSSLDDLRH